MIWGSCWYSNNKPPLTIDSWYIHHSQEVMGGLSLLYPVYSWMIQTDSTEALLLEFPKVVSLGVKKSCPGAPKTEEHGAHRNRQEGFQLWPFMTIVTMCVLWCWFSKRFFSTLTSGIAGLLVVASGITRGNLMDVFRRKSSINEFFSYILKSRPWYPSILGSMIGARTSGNRSWLEASHQTKWMQKADVSWPVFNFPGTNWSASDRNTEGLNKLNMIELQ